MNFAKISKALFLAGSFLLASSAFAAEKASIKVFEQVKVSGKELAPGTYNFEWKTNGENAEVTIRRGKEVILTAAAKVTPANESAINGYSATKQADGTKKITTLFFEGKKYTLELGEEIATATPANGSNSGNK